MLVVDHPERTVRNDDAVGGSEALFYTAGEVHTLIDKNYRVGACLLYTSPSSAAESLVLCFNIDCDAGLAFHGEVVGEDGDLLDELFDQSLVKLCDVGFLTGDEVLQLLNPCLLYTSRCV